VSEPVRTVYVSNGRGATVTPIATATGVPGPPIPIGRTAGDIAITPDGKTAYVTSDDGEVVPIATATAAAGPAIDVGGDTPDGIVITPDGKTVYVAVISTNAVVPIATATNRPGEPIELGERPRRIVISPDGTTAYVLNQSRPHPPQPSYEAWQRGERQAPLDRRGTVIAIDLATNTPGEPIDVGIDPLAIAITPDGKTVYVANTHTGGPGPSTVTPIDTAGHTAGPPIQVGDRPYGIAILP
jgi:hyaluronoglucosaminidase